MQMQQSKICSDEFKYPKISCRGKHSEEKGRNLESSETPIKMQISTLWWTLLRRVQKKSQWNIPDFLAPLHFHELFNGKFEFFNIQLWLSDWVSVNAFCWQKWILRKYHTDSFWRWRFRVPFLLYSILYPIGDFFFFTFPQIIRPFEWMNSWNAWDVESDIFLCWKLNRNENKQTQKWLPGNSPNWMKTHLHKNPLSLNNSQQNQFIFSFSMHNREMLPPFTFTPHSEAFWKTFAI